MATRRGLVIAALLLSGWGCSSSKKDREATAKDIEALAGDQCLFGYVKDEERERLMQDALRGKITQARVDEYIGEIRAKAQAAKRQRASVVDFCRVQRDMWRKHFRRRH